MNDKINGMEVAYYKIWGDKVLQCEEGMLVEQLLRVTGACILMGVSGHRESFDYKQDSAVAHKAYSSLLHFLCLNSTS